MNSQRRGLAETLKDEMIDAIKGSSEKMNALARAVSRKEGYQHEEYPF